MQIIRKVETTIESNELEIQNDIEIEMHIQRKDETTVEIQNDIETIPTKTNTADMTTKILPATTVSVFSKVVLGINDTCNEGTDSD